MKKPIKKPKKSVIQKLTKQQRFWISLVAMLNEELVHEQIITPMQKSQIENYMYNKIKT